jgi:hypothetical protein
MIRKFKVIIITLILLNSCGDPLSVDAVREKKVINDPNDAPAEFEFIPDSINIQDILIGEEVSLDITIKNLTSKNLILNNYVFKNYSDDFRVLNNLPIFINPKDSYGSNLKLEIKYKPTKYGYLLDTFYFQNFKKPILKINSIVPALYSNDLDFGGVSVGEYELKTFKFTNLSNTTAIINSFELIDKNNVFLNEPKVNLPIIIKPNSESEEIRIIFNPTYYSQFNGQIKINATFENKNYPFRNIINLKGNGI